MSKTDGYKVWISGTLIPAEDATVHAFDHAITVGDGVFETLEASRGEAFAVSRHLARIRRSAAALDIDPGFTDQELRDAIDVVLAESPGSGIVRVTVSPGRGPLGSSRGDSASTVIVAAAPGPTWGETTNLVTVEWTRNERGALVGVKSTSYAENVRALKRAHEAGAGEAIFANTIGNLCEGTGANVFLEVDGKLVTPPLTSGCLAGVTRELVLEVVDVVELDVPLDALFETNEIFITSTTRDVLAVARVDDHDVPSAPGPLTIAAREAFAEMKATTLDP